MENNWQQLKVDINGVLCYLTDFYPSLFPFTLITKGKSYPQMVAPRTKGRVTGEIYQITSRPISASFLIDISQWSLELSIFTTILFFL